MAFTPGIFSEKQLDVMANCTANVNILEGSVRSGKTISSILSFITSLSEYPKDSNILLAGKTTTSLFRNIIKPLEEIVGKTYTKFKLGVGEGTIFGRSFYAVGANDERAYTKIQGLTLSLAYGDEVAIWPESFFKMLLSRLSDVGARFIGTTNPEGPYHWLKVEYLDREAELDLKSWHFNLEDNLNLPKSYVENLKKLYTGLWFKRYILGLWVLAEGTVYDMFNEDFHVIDVPLDIWDKCLSKYVSIDYGTTNPCVFHLWGINEGKRYLKKEYYYDSKVAGRQKTDKEFVNDLKTFLYGERVKYVIVDPSAASFKTELRENGFNVIDAINDVLDGIRETAKEITERLIIIDKSCKNTIMEFGGYVWDVKACMRGDEKPLKQSDHCCFIPGTLITTDKGYIPIEKIKNGDKVLTRNGFKEVMKSGVTSKNADVKTITFDNGKTLTATGNHPIYVIGKGFIRLDTLRYGDYVLQDRSAEYLMLKKLSSMGLHLGDIQVQRGGETETIIMQTRPISKTELGNSIKKYGSSISAKSRKDVTSITKTETPLTTQLKTLNVSAQVNTSKSMHLNKIKIPNSLNGEKNTVWKSGPLQKNGMHQTKGKNGILKTENVLGNYEPQLKKHANNAEMNLTPSQDGTLIDSAQMRANHLGEEILDLITKHEIVRYVDQNLPQINTVKPFAALGVVQVKNEVQKETVYNLSVKDMHEYFANGVLVHNCDSIRYFVMTVPLKPVASGYETGFIGSSFIGGTRL